MFRYEIGYKIGNLQITSFYKNQLDKLNNKIKFWKLKCICGNFCIRSSQQLSRKLKHPHSCGCYRSDIKMPALTRKHNLYKHPNYKSWYSMHSRCYRTKDKDYKYYGARGIMVCERWHDIRNFIADMGNKPEFLTIDRINNNGNYEPNNCRWSSITTQNRNRNNLVILEANGILMTRNEATKLFKTTNMQVTRMSNKYKIKQQDAFNQIILEKGLRPEYSTYR